MNSIQLIGLIGKPLIGHKFNKLTNRQAIDALKLIFSHLEQILNGNAKPRATNTDEFKDKILSILHRHKTDKIDVWTAVDEVVDCFTTQNTEEE